MAGEFFEAARGFSPPVNLTGILRERTQGLCAAMVIDQIWHGPDESPSRFEAGKALEEYQSQRSRGVEDVDLWDAECALVDLFGRSAGAVYNEFQRYEPRRRLAALRREIPGINIDLIALTRQVPRSLPRFNLPDIVADSDEEQIKLAQGVSPASFWSHHIHGRVQSAYLLVDISEQTSIELDRSSVERSQTLTALLAADRYQTASQTAPQGPWSWKKTGIGLDESGCEAYLRAVHAFKWADPEAIKNGWLSQLADLTGRLASNFRAIEGIKRLGSN
ncbi:MAG TPA: hypothetical protein VJG66_03275 [Patescibacteria group bacterium]|nr:hypothetical protein [Patescibacteria group bacterium]